MFLSKLKKWFEGSLRAKVWKNHRLVCFQRLYSMRRAWNATAEYTRAGSEEPIRPPF